MQPLAFSSAHSTGSAHGTRGATGMYTDVSVQGAAASDNASHALIGMLFDAALGALAHARGAMREGDVPGKARAILPPATRVTLPPLTDPS